MVSEAILNAAPENELIHNTMRKKEGRRKTMWSENCNWANRTKGICPFFLADKDKRFSAECVHENCAWYSTKNQKFTSPSDTSLFTSAKSIFAKW